MRADLTFSVKGSRSPSAIVTSTNKVQPRRPSGDGRLLPSRRSVSPKQPGSPAVKMYTGGPIIRAIAMEAAGRFHWPFLNYPSRPPLMTQRECPAVVRLELLDLPTLHSLPWALMADVIGRRPEAQLRKQGREIRRLA